MVWVVGLMASMASANPITVGDAMSNVSSFLSDNGIRKTGGKHAFSLAYTINRKEKKEGREKPVIYVFEMEGGRGGVLASADDVAIPVLGYFADGEADLEKMPPNLRAWISGYADEIAWARDHGYSTVDYKKTVSGKEDIPFMVPTQWNQGSPYYLQCRFNNKYCYAGCAATVMAQIMYYWAVVGINGETFRHGSNAIEGYVTESELINVPALIALDSFDWDAMTTGVPNTTESKNAVAQLMRYCGQSVRMDYSRYGSGAYSEDIPMAFCNYFGYDSGAHIIYRDSMTAVEWEGMIYQELAEGRPVCMSGANENVDSGHAFICDGYKASSDKYHFNWGWSGSYDGYFALEALVPKKSVDYSYERDAVIGIQPPRENNEDTNRSRVTFFAPEDKGTNAGASESHDEVTKDGVTIAVSPQGSFGNSRQYRVYQGSSLSVASSVGKIVKIEIVCINEGNQKYGPGLLKNPSSGTYTYEYNTGTWIGNATEVVFDSCDSQVRILQLVVLVENEDDEETLSGQGLENMEASFDAAEDVGSQKASSLNPDELCKNGVTISVSPMGSLGNGQHYRVYQGSDLTLSTEDGNIVKAVFTCIGNGDEKYGPGCLSAPTHGAYYYEGNIGTWKGYCKSFSMTALHQVRIAHIDVTVTNQNYVMGDVDVDGKVTISDVLMTMNYIIGNSPAGFVLELADVNNDNVINISDVMKMASMIVKDSSESTE